MARIEGVNPEDLDDEARQVMARQARTWGAPLANHLIYARRPTIYAGARGMWRGLDASGLLDDALVALVNARVAAINGCVF